MGRSNQTRAERGRVKCEDEIGVWDGGGCKQNGVVCGVGGTLLWYLLRAAGKRPVFFFFCRGRSSSIKHL